MGLNQKQAKKIIESGYTHIVDANGGRINIPADARRAAAIIDRVEVWDSFHGCLYTKEIRTPVRNGPNPSAGWRNGGLPPIPRAKKVKPPKPREPKDSTVEELGTVVWTRRQLEHVGDAIFALAARLLCHDHFKGRQREYFQFACQYTANSVMGGTTEEIRVGRIFVGKGFQQALDTATNVLKETEVYKNMKKL